MFKVEIEVEYRPIWRCTLCDTKRVRDEKAWEVLRLATAHLMIIHNIPEHLIY